MEAHWKVELGRGMLGRVEMVMVVRAGAATLSYAQTDVHPVANVPLVQFVGRCLLRVPTLCSTCRQHMQIEV